MKKAAVYNLIFRQMPPNSHHPEEHQRALGLEPEWIKYAGTGAFTLDSGLRDAGFGDALLSRVNGAAAGLPYSTWLRPPYGNFEKKYAPVSQSEKWRAWSDFKQGRLSQLASGVPLSLVSSGAAAPMLARRGSRLFAELYAMLALMACVAFFTVIPGDADDIVRHMFLYNLLTDTCFAFAIIFLVESVTLGNTRRLFRSRPFRGFGGLVKHFLICAVLAIFAAPAFAGALNSAIALPNLGQVNTMVRDSAGNIYLGGGGARTVPPTSVDSKGAFVAKLSSDGSNLIFQTMLSTNNTDGVTALALAPDGSVLAAGLTEGNFPTTKDATEAQPFGPPRPTGFFARVDVSGKVVYASYLNPSSSAQFGITSSLAMATDSAGAAYITGEGLFDSTPGALQPTGTPQTGYFTVKLDQTGKQVWATGGIGGSSIVVDQHGFVYISGSADGGFPLPVTPGAFQPNAISSACAGNGFFFFACPDQYVAKLDPTASQLVYCTWLSGTLGASPSTLLVDIQGNAILAGSTQSFDYPVTPGALQTASFASQPLPPPAASGPSTYQAVPPNTGYVSKLNATGTALVFSTYLGGSLEDSVSAAAEDAEGNLYLAGFASSPDFPGVSGVPNGCRPSYIYPAPYVTRLSADASYLTETRLAYGLFSSLVSTAGDSAWRSLVVDAQGNALLGFNGALTNLSFLTAATESFCAVDPADGAPLTEIVPGQLVTLFGDDIGEYAAVTGQPRNGHIPPSLGDSSAVKIHGIPAPILYSSLNQINVQVPYEIAGQTSVKLEIDDPNGDVAGAQQFGVASNQPSAFSSGAFAVCGGGVAAPFLSLALNADGSVNSCTNAATRGSTVTLFVNGIGAAVPGLMTGAIATSPAMPLNSSVTISGDAQFVSAESDPGSVNGVWTVKVKMTGTDQPESFHLTVNGTPMRDPLAVWVK